MDIQNQYAGEIATALRTNSTLMFLNLRNNSIEDRGAMVIAKELKENKTLQKLSLNGNEVSDDVDGQISRTEPRIIFDDLE